MWTTWSPPQGREQDGEGWRLGLQGQAEDPQQTLFFLHPDVLVYFLLQITHIPLICIDKMSGVPFGIFPAVSGMGGIIDRM